MFIGAAIVLAGCSNDGGDEDIPEVNSANFTVTIENLAPVNAFIGSGVFNTPVGSTDPGAATPGKMYEFTINAGRSQHLSFAAMLAATNDLFMVLKRMA